MFEIHIVYYNSDDYEKMGYANSETLPNDRKELKSLSYVDHDGFSLYLTDKEFDSATFTIYQRIAVYKPTGKTVFHRSNLYF